jgi:ABC transport system ATP-binding/permease protein
VLEDFLDRWPGTLVVVSHDRYFLERVTDSVWALLGDGQISMLPRGVDEYLERRAADLHVESGLLAVESGESTLTTPDPTAKAKPGSAEERAARKTIARIDKRLERIAAQEAELNAEIAEHAHDYERLAELSGRLDVLAAEREELELEWLEAAELVE